jgi:lysophospholipase L1-like esterase
MSSQKTKSMTLRNTALRAACLSLCLLARPAAAQANLAQGKAATADASQAGHAPADGNDGSLATRWTAANAGLNHWWQVDLGSSQTLSGSEVTWEHPRIYKYRIQVSTNNSTWTTVADKTANASTVQAQRDHFGATARYVRITVTGLPVTPTTWAAFYEFKVFGVISSSGPPTDPSLRSVCTGTSPIRCHYDVNPGHYDVTVVLGDPGAAASTQVQVEARRLMQPQTVTPPGGLLRQTFTVDVREPEGQSAGPQGSDGLDLLFNGPTPRLNAIGFDVANPLVIYLAGDSTVCDQEGAPYTGWGQRLPQFFKLGTSVANYADSGESSGSFLANSHMFPVIQGLWKANDYLIIQFGHNDKTTTAATFKANLTRYITAARSRGAVPILVTPPVRRRFDANGKIDPTGNHVNGVGVDLPAAIKEVGLAQSVSVIDLTAKSRALLETLGATASQQLYLNMATDGITDNTHFSEYGANEMAKLILQAIREQNLPLVSRLR